LTGTLIYTPIPGNIENRGGIHVQPGPLNGFHPFPDWSERKIMARNVCKLLGVVFVLVGFAGFFNEHLLGAHLDKYHNLVHIVSGIIALYFGFAGSFSGARSFCLLFGVVYLALGCLGWFMGTGSTHLLVLGPLHLATVDHGIHVVLGVLFLAGGLFQKAR
jgi:hypothetical protein